MKKIYFIAIIAVLATFTACDDFNERNFPGYDEAVKPTNVVTYNYVLTDADYSAISKTALANSKTAADSVVAKAIATNKYFVNTEAASSFVPLLLATKYKFADEKSAAMIDYKTIVAYDTTKISSSNKYSLVMEDYDIMGTSAGTPGQYDNFSGSINPGYYLPIWLKAKYPYALPKDVKLIRYKFYTGTATVVNTSVFTYDGSAWIMFKTVDIETSKFVFKNNSWQYIDSDIFIGLKDGIGVFKTVNVLGDEVWAWDSYNYMKMTGYVSGSYRDNEDWLISPPLNLSERVSPWFSFMHVGRYFGDTGTSTEKMRKAITVWVSTTSDGTSIKASDWKQLTIPEAGYPSGANWTLITSTPISLAAYAGKDNVRIAFKYLSSAADNAAGTWEVKEFYVFEQ